MFKMRIINLVNISTVLLLINLLQTKSQVNVEQLVTVLEVNIKAQLKNKTTDVLVEWNPLYQDNSMPEYRKLLNETCKLFLPFVNEKVPQSTYGGECTNANFSEAPQDGSYSRVNAELRLIYKYSDNPQIQTDRLQDDLNDREEFITSESSFVAYNPKFTVKIEKLFIPISELQTTPPPTTAKNDASKKDDDDNGGEDSTGPIDTSVMTASGNKGKNDADDNGGEDSTAHIDTSAMTASGNKDERSTWTIIGIITLVVLIFVVIGGGITVFVKRC